MSRRERDARDSHGKRLHSRFDREPSPKKLKRDEKPEVKVAHSSHRNSSMMEATGHEPKQKSRQDDVSRKAPPASSTPGLQNEKKNLERKGDKPTVRTQHSSDNRDAPRSQSYYQGTQYQLMANILIRLFYIGFMCQRASSTSSNQSILFIGSKSSWGSRGHGGHSNGIHDYGCLSIYLQHDDRGIARQVGRSFGRREADHRKRDDSREQSGSWLRDDINDQPKKDERSQSHADEKTGIWRHDRFHELESGAPPTKKRPAFREKKMPAEPQQTGTAATESDKPKLPTHEQPDLASSKRGEERGGFHPPRALDKPDRTFSRAADDRRERRDVFYHRGEAQRNADPSSERYGAIRGRGDRSNVRYGARDSNSAGGFEVEKWKHDLFDEANRSPPRKNEEEQIAKVEALLAL